MADFVIQGTPTTPYGTGSTLAELRDMYHWMIDDLSENALPNSAVDRFSLDKLLLWGYERLAIRTKCFPVTYSIPAPGPGPIWHYRDFGTGAGARIFALAYVSWGGVPLEQVQEHHLNQRNRLWRSEGTGTPRVWLPWGERAIRLFQAPDTEAALAIEGYETPDPSTFCSDEHIADVHPDSQKLIPLWAVIMSTTPNPHSEAQLRNNLLYPQWNQGVKEMCRRIQNTDGIDLTFAGGAPAFFGIPRTGADIDR